ncbi:hypothetical protein FRB95_013133, partial [Tulasnella sp. JGI-2019a]
MTSRNAPDPTPFAAEITLQILYELPAEELPSVALVCKDWTWKAIDTLWREHPIKLSKLLSRLAPGAKNNSWDLSENSLALRLESVSRQEWMDFRARYADKVTHLEIDNCHLPRCVLRLPTWIRDLGPLCPRIATLDFLQSAEPSEADFAQWLTGLALISSPEPSIRVFDWYDPLDALKWLTMTPANLIQRARVTSDRIFPVHPTMFSHLRRLTLDGDLTYFEWNALALGCPDLQDLHVA